jgi:hypothetical protein
MDLSSHTSLAPLAEAIQEIYSAAVAEGLEIYLAGALARDLWLVFRFGIDTGRRTSDVDFAVQCRDWATFDRLRERRDGRAQDTGGAPPWVRAVETGRFPRGDDLLAGSLTLGLTSYLRGLAGAGWRGFGVFGALGDF